jgi:hypothetical protein
VPQGILRPCSECGGTIPSTNTTGVCVECTWAHETPEQKEARWDALIAEQTRVQASWGITPAMLRAACRAEELVPLDELDTGRKR